MTQLKVLHTERLKVDISTVQHYKVHYFSPNYITNTKSKQRRRLLCKSECGREHLRGTSPPLCVKYDSDRPPVPFDIT